MMGNQSRMRHYRRALRSGPPMRTVPSKRGLLTVFLAAAAAGAAAGATVLHFLVHR